MSKSAASERNNGSLLSIEQYWSKLRPFFNSQFARLDKLVNKRSGAKQETSENNQVKLFVIEAIGALIESIGNQKEEERILRSFLVHYDSYFNNQKSAAAEPEKVMQDAEVGTEIVTMDFATQADERSGFPDDLDA